MAMTTYKFAVFILTHGRPNKVLTYNTLRRLGYTGDIFIIVDNEDKTVSEYQKKFGVDKVIVFDKMAIASKFDTGDNFQERRAVFFARNACFGIAKELGIDYFLQFDDDYTNFYYNFTGDLKYHQKPIKNSLDRLLQVMVKYYIRIEAITIATCQTGDLIGGKDNPIVKNAIQIKRKAMNTFFCSTNRPFEFVGKVNEDVNTYLTLGNRGKLIFSIYNLAMQQLRTQSNKGGMTDLYLNEGTYIKSFYSVMYMPSCVKISTMQVSSHRIHHKIKWENAVPCIVDEKYRKRSQLCLT